MSMVCFLSQKIGQGSKNKASSFGTILLFSSLSTRRTTYSAIKSARKVGTVHTKIVLDYDSRRVSVSRTRRRRFFFCSRQAVFFRNVINARMSRNKLKLSINSSKI